VTKHIQVLVVDDQPRARKSLKTLLATWPLALDVREAANGREAIRLVEESRPDVVLMDVRMPEMDGIEATRLIKARWPQVKVIVLSMYPDYVTDALEAKADTFFSKGMPPQELLATLAAITGSVKKEESP
jgi:YesN/AraC family two-component response regulator